MVVQSDYAAGDEASFIKQFAQQPTQSLVYQQYAPSIPQYLQLAGSAANGVIWSTVVGILQNDPIAQPFIDKFTQKFGSGPGFSNAGDQYDLMHIWAQAAAMAGDPTNFDKINAYIKANAYRGVCGAYTFMNNALTCIPVSRRHRRSVDRHAASDVPDPGRAAEDHLAGAVHDRQVPAAALAPLVVSEAAPQPAATMLAAQGVTKLYGGLRAVDDLSFDVAAGEVLGIAGPNGAGKTTLFDTITGHTMATSGEIELAGQSIRGTKIHHRCRLGLARTFQQPAAADTLTALENAYLAASFRRGRTGRRSRSADVEAGMRALQLVGLEHRATMVASQLPVYDKKRLMLATALATDPLVLLLDEPFGGLNPGEIDATVALLKQIGTTGVAIVCIEHVMRALVALADRVLVMHHGAQLFLGTPSEMMRDERVIEVYLGAESKRHAGAGDA